MTKEQRDTILEELHNRYGAHLARRVQQELTSTELARVALEQLPAWLENRAETAHKIYQTHLGDPFAGEEGPPGAIDMLYRRWQQAEELAYVIAIAEGANTQAQTAGGK